jgi:hypothetical protein
MKTGSYDMVDAIPKARLDVMPEAGHAIVIGNPRYFVATVQLFMSQLQFEPQF